MCVILTIHYECSHTRLMPAPVVNRCEAKQTSSRIRGQLVRCPDEATATWDLASTNVCPVCSGTIYRYEKRYELVRNLQAMGYAHRLSPMPALDADQVRLWKIWVADRERFRQVGVRGGKDGELGQGTWSLRPWGKGGGFEEWYRFDGFLGGMGPFERKEVRGLEALYAVVHLGEGGEGDMEEGEEKGEEQGGNEPEGLAGGEEAGEGKIEEKAEADTEAKAEGSGKAGKKKNKKNKKKAKAKAKEQVME